MKNVHPLDAAATVPDVAVYFREFAAASAIARDELTSLRDLAYGSAPVETLDYFPAGDRAPLAVFIHGGYWRRLDKADFSFIARGLVPLGISFASVNYGLAPQTPLREIVVQCRRGVDWLRTNAEDLAFNSERISVFGHSAGGHLAAMTAVTFPVHSVVTLSGLHDLRPVQQSFVNEWLQIDADEAYQLSPIAYAPARACPIFATAGERESDAFKAQGRELIDAWTPHGCSGVYADSPGDNHFTICQRLADPADPLTAKIASLVS